MSIGSLCAALALVVAFIATVTDLRSARIPSWLSWPALLLGPCVWALAGGVRPLAYALLSVVACALVPLALYAFRAIGGGDVKLAGALGGLVGARLGLEILLVGFTLIAVVAVGRLLWRGELTSTLLRVVGALLPRRRDTPHVLPAALREDVRFAPSLLVGALVALLPELALRG